MWTVGAFGSAGLFAVWPWIDGFAAYLAMMVVLEIVSQAGWSGRGAYTLDVFPREERVQSQAFMRAALNIGFTSAPSSAGSRWRSTTTTSSAPCRG